jgi:hypothetical protein
MLNKVSKIVGDFLNEDTKVVTNKNEEVKNSEEKSSLSDIEDDEDSEIQLGKVNGQNGLTQNHNVSLYYWGLAKLGVPLHDPIFEALD